MTKAEDRDVARYEALKREVAEIDVIRRGSVVRRLVACGKPNCQCQATPPKLHGPYYQWTRKVRGKTVTVRLSRAEANLLSRWIANGRRLEKVIANLEKVSFRITERRLRATRRQHGT